MEPDRNMQKQRDQIEKVRIFPMKNLERLMRHTVPDAKLAEDFKELVNECAAEFIGFIVSESVDRSMNDGRSHLTSEDIVSSLAKLGFNDHHAALSLYLSKYRENIGTGHKEKGKESHANVQAMAQSGEMARQLQPISPRQPPPSLSLQQVSQQLHQLQQLPLPVPQMGLGPPPQKYQNVQSSGPYQQLPLQQPLIPPQHQPLIPPQHQPLIPPQHQPLMQPHLQPHQPHPHSHIQPHQQPHQQPLAQPHQQPAHSIQQQAPSIGQNSTKTLFQTPKNGFPQDGQGKTLFHLPQSSQNLSNPPPMTGPPMQREQVPVAHHGASLQPTNSIVQPKQISSSTISKLQPISQPLASSNVPLQNVNVQYNQDEPTQPLNEVSQGNVDNLRKMVQQQKFQIQAIQDLISKFEEDDDEDEEGSESETDDPSIPDVNNPHNNNI